MVELTMKDCIDCQQCRWHKYDHYIGSCEEWEECKKGHVLYPSECKDFKEL